MTKKDKPNFTFRVIKNGKTVDRCQTHSKRRFLNRIRTINWRNSPLRVYLRVSYGKDKDHRGHWQTFYNDGRYENKEELQKAWEAFTEC